jgi:flavin reductase (DIM6/NTAB) family NADH-FMN oxidoreductase RutF
MAELPGLQRLLTELDYPMVVVTTVADGERSGCLVGFQTQCSVHPPRLAVFLSQANHTYGVARRAEHLGVHFLGEEQRHLAELFGSRTGDEVDKFDRCDWRDGPGGVPLLEDCPSWLVGRVLERLPTGDHTCHLLEPIASDHRRDGWRQLGFQQVLDLEPGHDP